MLKFNQMNIVFVFIIILTPNIVCASYYYHEKFLIDTLLLCKNNIDNLEIFSTILKQEGWKQAEKDPKHDWMFEYLYKKVYLDETYEIGFSDYPTYSECIVRTLGTGNISNNAINYIFQNFIPQDNKYFLCRDYGDWPQKTVEWKFDNNKYIFVWYTMSKKEDIKLRVIIKIEKSKVKSHKVLRYCTKDYWE